MNLNMQINAFNYTHIESGYYKTIKKKKEGNQGNYERQEGRIPSHTCSPVRERQVWVEIISQKEETCSLEALSFVCLWPQLNLFSPVCKSCMWCLEVHISHRILAVPILQAQKKTCNKNIQHVSFSKKEKRQLKIHFKSNIHLEMFGTTQRMHTGTRACTHRHTLGQGHLVIIILGNFFLFITSKIIFSDSQERCRDCGRDYNLEIIHTVHNETPRWGHPGHFSWTLELCKFNGVDKHPEGMSSSTLQPSLPSSTRFSLSPKLFFKGWFLVLRLQQ